MDEVIGAFVHVVEAGLPAAAEAGLAGPELWTSLLASLSSFLAPSPAAAATASPPTALPPLFLPSVPVVLSPLFTGTRAAAVGAPADQSRRSAGASHPTIQPRLPTRCAVATHPPTQPGLLITPTRRRRCTPSWSDAQ